MTIVRLLLSAILIIAQMYLHVAHQANIGLTISYGVLLLMIWWRPLWRWL